MAEVTGMRCSRCGEDIMCVPEKCTCPGGAWRPVDIMTLPPLARANISEHILEPILRQELEEFDA